MEDDWTDLSFVTFKADQSDISQRVESVEAS